MKKFEIRSAAFVPHDEQRLSAMEVFVEAESLADVILKLESNSGWYSGEDVAFKAVYVKEIK